MISPFEFKCLLTAIYKANEIMKYATDFYVPKVAFGDILQNNVIQ